MTRTLPSLIAILVVAAFALAPGEASAQKKEEKHWADKPVAQADKAREAENRAKLEEAMKAEEAERRKSDQGAAGVAARKKLEDDEKRRIAQVEKQKEAERMKKEKEAACVYKAVMTDAEIKACRDLAR